MMIFNLYTKWLPLNHNGEAFDEQEKPKHLCVTNVPEEDSDTVLLKCNFSDNLQHESFKGMLGVHLRNRNGISNIDL